MQHEDVIRKLFASHFLPMLDENVELMEQRKSHTTVRVERPFLEMMIFLQC